MVLPLEGLLVVSIDQAVAAPMCARRLAEAGARVIKLERPEGDFARGYDDVAKGQSSYFLWLNRGKESVTVDLRNEDDRRLFNALLEKADVFIQNMKPGSLERLGLGIKGLRAANPKLITCSISGYGTSGPYVNRKAYDLLIQAEAGLASVTGGPEAPSRVGVSVVDIATGMYAYEAILEALIARGRTGEGAHMELSMFDCMAEWMAVPLIHGTYARAPQRMGLKHPSVAPYGVFECADGTQVLIAVQNDREWARFCRIVLGDPSVASDDRFAANVARVANREATDALVQARLGNRSAAEIVNLLDEADVAFGLVNTVDDVLKHPCLRQIEVKTPAGPITMPAPPARSDLAQRLGAVQAVGASTSKVRQEFLG